MEISALASGSSGNCFYVEHNDNAILVDAGISAKRIVEKLEMLKRNPEIIKRIFGIAKKEFCKLTFLL